MMYVPFPTLSQEEALSGLARLDLDDCCDSRTLQSFDAVIAVADFKVEMWGGTPWLRATLTTGERVIFDLKSGEEVRSIEPPDVRAAGLRFGRNAGLANDTPLPTSNVFIDQWTVQESFARHRPMVRFHGSTGVEWYVSSRTGEVVQITEPLERMAGWFGAVLHWLYLTPLRQFGAIWSQVVIWLTLISLFLVLTGIAIGIKQFRPNRSNRRSPYNSPYKSWNLWHHYLGLASGVFLLIWLFSGLVSMNPWGTLEGRSFTAERERYRGEPVTLSRAYRFLAEIRDVIPSETVRLDSNVVNGIIEATAYGRDAAATRLGARGVLGPVLLDEVDRHARRMRPEVRVTAADTLTGSDAYYYEHHEPREFPVHRVTYADGERYYFSPATGQMMLAVDANKAWYRWLFRGLHTGDFHALARTRPLWDGWMLPIMLLLVASATTGVVLAYRRVSSRKRQPTSRKYGSDS
jgi:uncharacterized iron-regulated membrane protein